MGLDTISMSNCRYRGYFADLDGGKWQCDILTGGGTAEEIKLMHDSPLTIEWRGEELFNPVVRSRATLRILSTSDRKFIDLYSASGRDVYLAVYRNSRLYWIGSIEPEQYEEPYSFKDNYVTELTFNDFAVLERTKFRFTGRMSVADIIRVVSSHAFRPTFECDWIQDIPRPEIVYNCSTRISKINLSAVSVSPIFLDTPPDTPPPANPDYPNPNPNPYDPDAPGLYDPNVPWQQQLQDELSVQRLAPVQGGEDPIIEHLTLPVLRSWHSPERGLQNVAEFSTNWGAGCLEEAYVNLDVFYDEDGGISMLDVLTDVLRPFTLRIEQRNGRIQVYDIHGSYRWMGRGLKSKGTGAMLGVDRVYNNAEISISLAERTELMPGGDGIKRITTPTHSAEVPNIDTNCNYIGYRIDLKTIQTSDTEYSIVKDGSSLFNVRPVTCGSKERGVMVWMRNRPNISLQMNGEPAVSPMLPTPNHAIRAQSIMSVQSPIDLTDAHACYCAKDIMLPVRTQEMMDNFSLGLSIEVMLSMNYNLYQPYTEDNTDDDKGLKWWKKQFDGKEKVLRLVARIYACDENGNRLMALRKQKIGQWANVDAYYKPTWEDISSTDHGSQYVFLQFGSSLKDGFDVTGWNNIEEVSSATIFSTGGYDIHNNYYLFPLPPKGVKLEVLIMNRPWLQVGKINVEAFAGEPMYHSLGIFALKGLDVRLIRNDGSTPEDEDLVLKAWLDADAFEEYAETLRFTSDSLALPNSLALLTDKDGNRLSHKFKRGKYSGTVEQLYLNSVFTAYSQRHSRITGEYDPSRGLWIRVEDGKRYLVTVENEECRTATSNLEMVEVELDRMAATEIIIED